MKSNKYLNEVKRNLPQYFSYFKNNNTLVISESKEVLPFAYLIRDKAYPDHLILSLAVDYASSKKAVEIALVANHTMPIALAEDFYIAKSGITHIGDDAGKYFQLDNINLDTFDVENELVQ